jgi:uncharacterized RDD family membrane protein YckC
MVTLNYRDFDLVIERLDKGYRARVINSPGGLATGDFELPFSDLEVENFLLKAGVTRRSMRRLDAPEMEAAKNFGGRLFNAVFSAEVGRCFRRSLDQMAPSEGGLRIRLHLTEAPELADLPWEYLYQNSTFNRFLSLSIETPLVRYLELPEPIRPLAVRPPLRILVMISSPSDYPALDVDREWTSLKRAVAELERRGLVVLERLEEATLLGLQRQLRRQEYHIFHFVGHGGFDRAAQDGVLLLEDESKRGRRVSGQDLGALLHNHRPLRLAVLNACEGARPALSDPFAGTAQSLLQQGIPAVVAMQFEISDEAAITFAQELYGAVADGYPVDGALAEARLAIRAQGNDIEWGTPVLYMRAPDGRVFERIRAQDPLSPDPDGLREAARREIDQSRVNQRLATLYYEGLQAMDARDWRRALTTFEEIERLQPGYREAAALAVRARKALVEKGASKPSVDQSGGHPVTSEPAHVSDTGSLSLTSLPRAGWWSRCAATLIDSVILSVGYTILVGIFGADLGAVLALGAEVGYFVYFWSKSGQTPGDSALNLRVIRTNGKPLDTSAAFLRVIGWVVSSFAAGLGFLWAAWDPEKQGWHDKMAGTYVVRIK